MAILTVTTANDQGTGSLREAIARANPGDTIKFSRSLRNQTIRLNSSLVISKSITVDGSAANQLTISGEGEHQVFSVQTPGTNVTLKNMAIANGFTTDKGGGVGTDMETNLVLRNVFFSDNIAHQGGGAVYSGYRSTATVLNSRFVNNDGSIGGSEHGGGAILIWSESQLSVKSSVFGHNKGHNGGAINSLLSELTVTDSRFVNNDARSGASAGAGYGGAIYTDGASDNNNPDSGTILIRNSQFDRNQGAGQGGALFLFAYPPDRVILEDSMVTNNSVVKNSTGDALGGGLRHGNSELVINNSTFADNRASVQGGGVWLGENSPVAITNSTFSGNQADDGTGNGLGGAIMIASNTGSTTITHSTIVNNEAGFMGGGFFVGNQPVTLTNSLIADNHAGNPWNKNHHSNRQLNEGGGNLQYPAPQTTDPQDVLVTATITVADPQLLPFSSYGGATFTYALAPDSPALDAGLITPVTTDQRGGQRDRQPDIGAFEQATPFVLIGTPRAESLLGSNGRDRLVGKSGNDILVGKQGRDVLRGDRGHDRLVGNSGNDKLLGNDGRDVLLGGTGNDRLVGGDGNDILNGGRGADILKGGNGRDRFQYDRIQDRGDRILDFQRRDKLDLKGFANSSGFDSRDPFQNSVSLEQRGRNTLVNLTINGRDRTLVTLINTTPDQIRQQNFLF